MFSCKSAPKIPVYNQEKVFHDLRTLPGQNFSIKLSEFKLDFNEKIGDWRSKNIFIYL